MKNVLILFVFCLLTGMMGCANAQEQKNTNNTKPIEEAVKMENQTKVLMKTTMGDMTILLYNETPKHRDNFIKLVEEGYYDGLLFHRVIPNFMIQGGDPDSKGAPKGKQLGMGDPGYTIPAEFVSTLTHKKGALAAARTNNPQKASSGSQFSIVQNEMGCRHLNGEYTVFGIVVEGLDVIDKIVAVPTDYANRPLDDVKIISATIIK